MPSGSCASWMPDATVTAEPTVPLARIGVSMMRDGAVPFCHRTCRTPSLPRTSPISGSSASTHGVVTRVQWPGRMADAAMDAVVPAETAVRALAGADAAPRDAASVPAARTEKGRVNRFRNMDSPV